MRDPSIPLILFETVGGEQLGPPVALRPLWELRVGARRLVDRVLDHCAADSLHFWSRTRLRGLCPTPPDSVFAAERVRLLAGNQLILDGEAFARFASLEAGQTLELDGRPVAACLPGGEARAWLDAQAGSTDWPQPSDLPMESALGPCLHYWWELYELAPRALAADLRVLLASGGWRREDRMDWREAEDIHLAADAELAPGVIIDASGGPVLLDRGVKVGALSFLQGPCYLGPGTRVKPHSQLLHGCFAGPQCRLGGEIEETQFQGYANKQHHGFLGHAAVGEWVNLGAGATNSDLKNNYSAVRVRQGGRELESRRRFLGCCLGDHVKVGIQARLNTGTVLEPFSNWFGADFPPKGLPAFVWGGDGGLQTYHLDKALETAAMVMSRRDRELGTELREAITALFGATASARASLVP